MSTSGLVVLVVSTALLSSVATVVVAVAVGRRWLAGRMAAAGEDIERRFAAAAEEAGPRLRGDVAAGVRDGAEDVLPRMRAQVREGVVDGLRDVLSSRTLGREVARRSASVIDAGLDALFGRPPDDDE